MDGWIDGWMPCHQSMTQTFQLMRTKITPQFFYLEKNNPTSLPSASRWQRIFAVCWQMAKRWGWYAVTLLTATGFANLLAICWQMAKIICHPLADGKELADGNHVLCRLSVLCHLFL